MQRMFGSGLLSLVPSGANPTPIGIGILQDISFDNEQQIKTLLGQNRVAIDAAGAELKITGSSKTGMIMASALAAFYYGSTATTGSKAGAINEVGTIPATATYIVTVAHSATFDTDLGVIDTTTALPMSRVASGPTTGQYSVSAGVYTFAAADASKVVWISYRYTSVGGYTVAVNNQLMGSINSYELNAFNTYTSLGRTYQLGAVFPAIVIPKLALAGKNTDYTMTDLSFQVIANNSGLIGTWYTTE